MSVSVVVGVDGSPSSLDAVDAAAHEAAWRGGALQVVHAFSWPASHPHLSPSPLGPVEDGLRALAMPIVSEAVQRARATAPEVEVSHAVVIGEPVTVLVRQAEEAALLVVGSRGLGGFTGLLAGSVAVELAAHAPCPVLVVRGEPDPLGGVLLGVDGSPAGAAAVGFAFAEASLRGADLTALHVWDPRTGPQSGPAGEPKPVVYDTGLLRDEEELLLAEALSGWQDRYPDVTVHRRLVQARTRTALIEASAGAGLLVVGARGRGGFAGLLLGSVSQAVLHHAHCPVVVVRSAEGGATPDATGRAGAAGEAGR